MAGTGKKILRAVIAVVATLILLFVLANVVYIYLGGYWENMAVLNKISGPKRFRQFVVNPIPPNIHNLRGGYSGFPQGIIRTYFSYSEDFSNMGFLEEWEKVKDTNSPKPFAHYMNDINATIVYRKKRYETYMYLLINEEGKKGMLYLP